MITFRKLMIWLARESTDIDQESSNGNHQGDSLEVEVLEWQELSDKK